MDADDQQENYQFRCGCTPTRGQICTTHCQWQDCTGGTHTAACIAGNRTEN